jgi:hypothetical protein
MTHARRVPCPAAVGDPVVANLTVWGAVNSSPAETNPSSLAGTAARA